MYRTSELFVLWIDNGLGKELESLIFESFEDAKKYGDIVDSPSSLTGPIKVEKLEEVMRRGAEIDHSRQVILSNWLNETRWLVFSFAILIYALLESWFISLFGKASLGVALVLLGMGMYRLQVRSVKRLIKRTTI